MFPNVATQILIKKLAELIKLPNQTETNARDFLEFIFDPENNKETEFYQFYAFLAIKNKNNINFNHYFLPTI